MNAGARGVLEVYNSVGGAAFFERLLAEWESAGWQVRRHYAVTERDYRASGGRIARLRLRWRMYGGFGWRCWRAVRRGRAAAPVRVVTTNPFFAPALAQRAARGTGATVNLLYDLFPDALVQAGVLREDSWLARRCAAITRRGLRECEATVFLGAHLRDHAQSRYGPAKRAVIIPVGADGAPFRGTPPEPAWPADGVTVLHAGQMGRMHDVATLRAMLREGVPAGVNLFLYTSGTGGAQLRCELPVVERLHWGGALPEADWRRAMREAQVALVSVAGGAEGVVMPSKVYSALVAGQAVVAVCRGASDLADLVRRHDCGWVVEPGDASSLRAVLDLIVRDPMQLQQKRENAYQAGHEHYDMGPIARQWEALFESLREMRSVEQVGVDPSGTRG